MPAAVRATAAAALSFFLASDTHLGHDVACPGCPGNITTSLFLNTQFVLAANALARNASAAWPPSLGGGPVLPPRALVVSGDLVDNGYTESYEWANWTRLFGLDGTDGMLAMPVYEGRGNQCVGSSRARARARERGRLLVRSRRVDREAGVMPAAPAAVTTRARR